MLVSLPFGTLSMSSFTSMGAGTTKVPVPHRWLSLPSIVAISGRFLLSRSFSAQVFRAFIGSRIKLRDEGAGKIGDELAFVCVVHGEDNESELFAVGEMDGVFRGRTLARRKPERLQQIQSARFEAITNVF